MSYFQRTTRACTLDELRPELAEAIRTYAQRQQWDNLEAEVLACCETTTERTSANRLDAWLNGSAAAISHVALIATPHRLIWAYSSDRARAGAASAQYHEMRLKIFTPNSQRVLPWIFMRAWMGHVRKRVDGSCWTAALPRWNSVKKSSAPLPRSVCPQKKSRAASGSGGKGWSSSPRHPIGMTFE